MTHDPTTRLRTRALALLRPWISLAAYQAAWWACVAAAARGRPLWGVAAVAAQLAWQLATSRKRSADGLLILLAIAVGLMGDTALGRSGWLRYAAPGPLPGYAPAWILALWAQFGSILREPLRWLHGRPALTAMLGGAGGALSYAAAARMGACQFVEPARALGALVLAWAVMAPALMDVARRLDSRLHSS
ncbi:MAG: DUF2878 domain-containing protein [Burkholderiales bacterium]|nr:DUF2878 family protein [Burkholderiales bacterium]MDE1926484.1 DUF2878 domain-containing protein [Burkholderiales bacterium]MDE2504397.1 DUF2878 domain-containing protein [Burkholderiales bacterium]